MKPIDISQLPENDPRSWMTEEQYATRLNALQQKSHSDLSEDDVRILIREFNDHEKRQRYIVLHLYRTQGWKTLSYKSFEEFGQKELTVKRTRLYYLRRWAECEIILFGESVDILGNLFTPGEQILMEKHARVLSLLTEPIEEGEKTRDKKLDADAIRSAYARAKELAKTWKYPLFQGKPHPSTGKITVKILKSVVYPLIGKTLSEKEMTDAEEDTVWATPSLPYKTGSMKQEGRFLMVSVQVEGKWHRIPFSVGEIKHTLGVKL